MKDFGYFKPRTLKEASQLLIENGEKAHILNGGTDLIVRMKDEITKPDVVVDIKGIQELHEISFNEDEGLTVGACVTLNELAHNKIVQEKYKILSIAAESVGSGQVRNLATMIGNNCNASPLADTSTPLLVLDAKVLVYSSKGEREVSIHDFFKGVRKTCLNVGEIVKAIKIPAYDCLNGMFQKTSRRSKVDLSTVCSSVVQIDKEIRIALGAVAPTPIRARKAEEYLKHKELTDSTIKKAAELAASDAKPIDDVRASRDYRIEMIKVLVKRSLEQLIN